MTETYICDAVRTPIGRYGGGLASTRTDDLAAVPLRTLMQRNENVDWRELEDVILGCANQAGEDNRNVARMALLLAGLPQDAGGVAVNRLCGSGLNAVGDAARTIKAGEADLMLAGGIENMSRAPLVMGKALSAYDRSQQIYDTTMGWRFVNRKMEEAYGTDAMPRTAENLAEQFGISREDQDGFALWSQTKAAKAQAEGLFAAEITAVHVPRRKADPLVVDADEHLRATSLDKLASLKPLFEQGSITAGNASGINDGAAALLLASESGIKHHGLTPKARVLGTAVAGVEPRTMGIGPVPASQKLLGRLGIDIDQVDIIELNEAFAAQVLACTRQLGLADDDARINPLGGAIALGHPLGMSGARLVTTAVNQLGRSQARYALCSMCVGVGQGIAMVIERI